ncbi:MAG: type 4a pilus biogenesis protein PilO [Candidatus Levyibacteriota bacterium]
MKLFDKKLLSFPRANNLIALFPSLKEQNIHSFTTLALTLATVSFFGIFAISPTLSTIADLRRQIDDSDFVNQKLQLKITNLSILQEKYQQLTPDLPTILSVVPDSAKISDFTGQIQAIANSSNINLTRFQTLSIDIGSTPVTTNIHSYMSFAFSLEAEGQYHDLSNFIASLATFNRNLTIDLISVTSVTTQDNLFRLSIRGKTYFEPK